MPEWYCRLMGTEMGPYSATQLVALARIQRLSPEDMVRKGLTGEWVPAFRVRGLFEAAAAPEPPGPPSTTPAAANHPPGVAPTGPVTGTPGAVFSRVIPAASPPTGAPGNSVHANSRLAQPSAGQGGVASSPPASPAATLPSAAGAVPSGARADGISRRDTPGGVPVSPPHGQSVAQAVPVGGPGSEPADWFCLCRGSRNGPMSFEQLNQLASTGLLRKEDRVWRASNPKWHPAVEIVGLSFSSSPAGNTG